MQKQPLPNRRTALWGFLLNAYFFWEKIPRVIKVVALVGLALILSGLLLPEQAPAPRVDFEQLLLAVVQTIGILFKTLIVNGGALAKPLVEPMLWIGALYWAFVLGIGGPYWFSNFLRRKFGR